MLRLNELSGGEKRGLNVKGSAFSGTSSERPL